MESSVGDEHYRRQKLSPDELFGLFSDTTGFEENLKLFEDLLDSLQINKNEHREIYSKLKTKLTSWKCQSLWDLIDSRGSHAEYEKGKVCSHLNVLVIGAGPIGLRTAIETAFLGCKTVIVEKRTSFTRNNVLHLWPFLLTDFRALGAKKFYGKFCAGSIDHISIKQLQNILLKICLILGVKIIPGTEFKELVEPAEGKGWKGLYSPQRDFLTNFQFDVIIGADGKKDVLPGFPQIEMRGALAIGITCNFVNENTMAEAGIEEISGIAYQFNPKFFDDLKEQFNVGLENIVYYKDETHYFVMTILKSSLLKRGALKQDFSDPSKLLDKQNIDDEKLLNLTLDTVHYATNYQLPPHLKLASNPNGSPDIAVFDFTSLKKASNACRMMERKGKRLLITLVGDSLLQPFWPTGSGCGRGVLSSLDTAWMIRLFGMNKAPLTVLWEREKIFKLLSGTNSEHLQKNYKSFTIDPKTRYANLNHSAAANVAFLKKLYDTDDPDNADFTLPENIIAAKFEVGRATTLQLPRSKRKSIGKRRSHSAINHKRRSDRTTLKDAKHVSKAKAAWESKIPKGTGISGASKRTRPSESRSGSSGLSSLSESDREEPVGPYQRAMSLRKRNQSSEQSEVFSTSTASSTEALDVFDDSHRVLLHDNKQPRVDVQHHRVLGHKHAHAHTSGDRLAYKHGGQDSKHNGNHGKSGGGVMRFLFGRGKTADAGEHHDAHREKRKSVAARKSLSRARRLRRRSGATSSQSKSEDEENLLLLKQRQGGLQSVTIRKRPNRHQVQNEETKASDKPSAKELIAAAEERDMRSAIEGTSSKSESLKRKADQMKDESKTATSSRLNNVAWKHCLPAVEPLLTDDNKDGGQEEGAVVESLNSLKNASQLAGLLLLAVPLLLPCSADNTLTINTGNKPRNMFAEKKNAFSRTSTEKMETKKISIKRAGSVQKAVQNWNKSKQEDAPTQDFNDFKRNRSSGSLKKDGSFAGQRWSFHGRPSEDMQRPPSLHNPVNMDDYEIIEMKGGGNLQPKESLHVEDDFDVISGSEFRREDEIDWMERKRAKKMTKATNKKKKPVEILRDDLDDLCKDQRPSTVTSLEILQGIHEAIVSNTNVDKFYRIYTHGREFENYVWNIDACRDILKQVGWQLCGKFIVLSKSTSVHQALDCIDEAKRNLEQTLGNKLILKEKQASNKNVSTAVPKINVLSAEECEQQRLNAVNQNTEEIREISEKIEIASSLKPEFISKEELRQIEDDLSLSSEQENIESSQGFIGKEEYLIVDFTWGREDQVEDRPRNASGGKLKRSRHVMAEDAYGKDGRRRRRRPTARATEDSDDNDRVTAGLEQRNGEKSQRAVEDEDEQVEQRGKRRSLKERMMASRGSLASRINEKQTQSQFTKQEELDKNKLNSQRKISDEKSNDQELPRTDGRRRRRSGGRKQEDEERRAVSCEHVPPAYVNNKTIGAETRDSASKALDAEEKSKRVCKMEEIKPVDGDAMRNEVDEKNETKYVRNLENLLKVNESTLFEDSGGEVDGEKGKKKKKKLVVKKGSLSRFKLQQNGELFNKDEKRSLKKSGIFDVEVQHKKELESREMKESNGFHQPVSISHEEKIDVRESFDNNIGGKNADDNVEERKSLKCEVVKNGLNELRISDGGEVDDGSTTKARSVRDLIAGFVENKDKKTTVSLTNGKDKENKFDKTVSEKADTKDRVIVSELKGNTEVKTQKTAVEEAPRKGEKKRKLVLKIKRKKTKPVEVKANGISDGSVENGGNVCDEKINNKIVTEQVEKEQPVPDDVESNNVDQVIDKIEVSEEQQHCDEKIKKKKFVLKRKKKT